MGEYQFIVLNTCYCSNGDETQVYYHDNYKEQRTRERALKNSYYTVTVYDESMPIGMGRVVGDGLYFTMVDIIVRPEYQGKKIGTAIIENILNHIEAEMCSGSRVSVQLISEVGKEEFYIKQGFKLIPHEFCGPALRKIIHK